MKPATWVVGDVHGCFETLERLLDRAAVDLDGDRLVMVGDLVNRGPRSLDVLRWAHRRSTEMGERFEAVLGNHDLHLLARARGVAEARPKDTLDDVLGAPDREELTSWLLGRPLAVGAGDALVVHAGVLPAWDEEETLRRAAAVSAALQGPDGRELLRRPPEGGGEPPRASATTPLDALRRDLSAFTRLRMLDPEGRMTAFSGPPDQAPPGHVPWYRAPGRRTAATPIVFGHWAALGLFRGPDAGPGAGARVYGIDSGCAWGRRLTALRLDDRAVVQVEVVESEAPRPGWGDRGVNGPGREPPPAAG